MDMVFLYTSNDHSIVNYFLTLEGFPEKIKKPALLFEKDNTVRISSPVL